MCRLDNYAPFREIARRKRSSDPWWLDGECRLTRNATRKFKRRYKTETVSDRSMSISSRHRIHQLVNSKSSIYLKSRIWTPTPWIYGAQQNLFWRKWHHPAKYWKLLTGNEQASTNSGPSDTFSNATEDCRLAIFDQVIVDEMVRIICYAPFKQSRLCTSVLQWLLKDCIDLLDNYIFNCSIKASHFSSFYEDIFISPLLTKHVLGNSLRATYQPVAFYPWGGKMLERQISSRPVEDLEK